MDKTLEQLQTKIAELEKEIKSLKNSNSIPFDVDRAFRDRFRINTFVSMKGSAKAASSENQSVSEGGVASYSVLKPPDGFDERTDDGVTKYYPYYT